MSESPLLHKWEQHWWGNRLMDGFGELSLFPARPCRGKRNTVTHVFVDEAKRDKKKREELACVCLWINNVFPVSVFISRPPKKSLTLQSEVANPSLMLCVFPITFAHFPPSFPLRIMSSVFLSSAGPLTFPRLPRSIYIPSTPPRVGMCRRKPN